MHKFFKFFSLQPLVLFSLTSLISCGNGITLDGGSTKLNGKYGTKGNDSRRWIIHFKGEPIKTSLFVTPSDSTLHFDSSDIWVDDTGIVNWSNKLLPGQYSFFVNAEIKETGSTILITSKLISLTIEQSDELFVCGGSTVLNGEFQQSFLDQNKWFCKLNGKNIFNVEFSLFSNYGIPDQIFIQDNCINWTDKLPIGKYMFFIKAKYVDSDNKTYEGCSLQITLNIIEQRQLNVTPGTLNLIAPIHRFGYDKLNWKVNLFNSIGSAKWSLVPLSDQEPIPSWLNINETTGNIFWTDAIDKNYDFKVKVDYIEVSTGYHYSKIDDRIVHILCDEPKQFTVNFSPTGKISPIGKTSGIYEKSYITAKIGESNFNLATPGTKIDIVDFETNLSIPGLFTTAPSSGVAYMAFLQWDSNLVPSFHRMAKVKIEYHDQKTGSYYIGYSNPFEIHVMFDFANEDWEKLINFSYKPNFSEICKERYGVESPIGLEKNILLNDINYKLRVIGWNEDFQDYDEKTGVLSKPAALTFEFINVISNEKTHLGVIENWNNITKSENSYWHLMRKAIGSKIEIEDHSCSLRLKLIDKEKGLIASFPDGVKNNIKKVYKGCVPFGSTDKEILYGRETLFLLGMSEYGIESSGSQPIIEPIDGKTYSYYANNKNLVKLDLDGEQRNYWFRTTRIGDEQQNKIIYCDINEPDKHSWSLCNQPLAFAPAFCI